MPERSYVRLNTKQETNQRPLTQKSINYRIVSFDLLILSISLLTFHLQKELHISD